MAVKSFPELVGLANDGKTNLTDLTRTRLLGLLSDEIRATNRLELESLGNVVISNRVRNGKMTQTSTSKVIDHDLFVAGGRAAWAIEHISGHKLPPVTEESTSDDIEDAVFEAHYAIQELLIPPAERVDVSAMAREQSVSLAKAKDPSHVTLAKLSRDSDVEVRQFVAANPATPVQVLHRLNVRDSDTEVHALAWKNLQHARTLSR